MLRLAGERADVVLVTGGLGPTEDDITRDVLADPDGDATWSVTPEIEAYLRERFAGFGSGEMPANNLRQADVPEGARFIMPERGTAPGLIAEIRGGATVYAMPGVPAEMVEMMESTIVPELATRVGDAVLVPGRSDAPASASHGSPRSCTTCSRPRRTRASPTSHRRAR